MCVLEANWVIPYVKSNDAYRQVLDENRPEMTSSAREILSDYNGQSKQRNVDQ